MWIPSNNNFSKQLEIVSVLDIELRADPKNSNKTGKGNQQPSQSFINHLSETLNEPSISGSLQLSKKSLYLKDDLKSFIEK